MDPFQLEDVWVPPEYLAEIRAEIESEAAKITTAELIDNLMDVHAAVAKLSFAARAQPSPVDQVLLAAIKALASEVMRLGVERRIFRDVLTIPGRE